MAMIDTGSSFSYVPDNAFTALLDGVAAWCAADPAERCIGAPVRVESEVLCYQTTRPSSFPVATFLLQAAGGDPSAGISFPAFTSMPWYSGSPLCLAVYNNGKAGTVIGLNALTNKTLAFDVTGGRLGVGADTGVCASPMATPSETPSDTPSASATYSSTPLPTASSAASGTASPAPAPPLPAAHSGQLAPGALAAASAVGAVAACGAVAALLWRALRVQRGSKGPGSDELGGGGAGEREGGGVEARPNPASAASRRPVTGDVASLWQTAAEGGSGTMAAAARAEALRESLLLNGDAPLPLRPSEPPAFTKG